MGSWIFWLLVVRPLKRRISLRVCVLSAPYITPFERPFDWNLSHSPYNSIRPVKCLTHFYLTVSSFLLAFLIWTNWSRCHSPPIQTLSLAFHYRVLDCTRVWDKLVMSKVKLYPGLCNSIHLSKRGGEKAAKKECSKLLLSLKDGFTKSETHARLPANFWSRHERRVLSLPFM